MICNKTLISCNEMCADICIMYKLYIFVSMKNDVNCFNGFDD